MGHRQTFAPDAAEIERLADAAIARLPEQFRAHLKGVVLRIDDFADEEVLNALGIDNEFDLSGLYSGRSLDKQSSWVSGELPAMIHLYRRPCSTNGRRPGSALKS
jgi:predicted Zn-dependent protease with MMP-like domain